MEFIQRLKAIQPVDTEHLILGYYHVDEGDEHLETLLYRKADVELFDPNSELAHIDDVSDLSDDEIERLSQLRPIPDSYAYELSPWYEILGYEVCEDNVQEIGPAKLAAAVIYEMTFFGYTEADVDRERKKLDEAIAEEEAIRQLPPEEQAKHFYSIDEVFAELGIPDERTDEEKELACRAIYRESLKNQLRIHRLLAKYR
jgi:hypothetical protein